MSKVLIVEDDKDYAELLSLSLKEAGYDVDFANTIKEAHQIYSRNLPDMILLDIMLPDGNGYEFSKHIIANQPSLPIIMLSAVRQSEEDKILGLECGAIDYVLKSHSHKELLARIRRALERQKSYSRQNLVVLKTTDKTEIVLDQLHQKALINTKPLLLTSIEFQLLYVFIENVNKVLARNAILKMVWEFEPKESQTLKVHLYRLRKKLNKLLPKESFDIVPVRGTGYMLAVRKIFEEDKTLSPIKVSK